MKEMVALLQFPMNIICTACSTCCVESLHSLVVGTDVGLI